MHPLEHLAFPIWVAKRAQYDAFEVSVTEASVCVRNCSHDEPAEHESVASVADGVPAVCECLADERFDGACKHRVAVAIRTPVMAKSVAADGGVDEEVISESDSDVEDGTPDDCECGELPGAFPCWECVRTGRRTLPDHV